MAEVTITNLRDITGENNKILSDILLTNLMAQMKLKNLLKNNLPKLKLNKIGDLNCPFTSQKMNF